LKKFCNVLGMRCRGFGLEDTRSSTQFYCRSRQCWVMCSCNKSISADFISSLYATMGWLECRGSYPGLYHGWVCKQLLVWLKAPFLEQPFLGSLWLMQFEEMGFLWGCLFKQFLVHELLQRVERTSWGCYCV
jgi:hypothetical protein